MRAWTVVFLLIGSSILAGDDPEFENPKPVAIVGYSGDAMEPFIARDGSFLIFNNSNAIPSETDLHWAERVDDLTFAYRGKLAGANSAALDAVGSVDRFGNIVFITTRSYAQDLATIYRGRFARDGVTDVAPLAGISRRIPGQLNFDAEISADGEALYFVDGLFTGGALPAAADLALAHRTSNGEFHQVETDVFAAINTAALEYAPSISENELELFFTRVEGNATAIYRSTRAEKTSRWGNPNRLSGVTGLVEAATIAPGGKALYYHALRDGHYVIERVTRRETHKRRAIRR